MAREQIDVRSTTTNTTDHDEQPHPSSGIATSSDDEAAILRWRQLRHCKERTNHGLDKKDERANRRQKQEALRKTRGRFKEPEHGARHRHYARYCGDGRVGHGD
jgi:hypothetical protein